MRIPRPAAAALLLTALLASACSIKRLAINKVADTLASPDGGTVFTGDNDPELIGDALPFAIKMYESLMNSAPWHQGLRLRTGSLYIMYANAFIQTPAVMLPDSQGEQQKAAFRRAKNLYLRGRDMLLQGLETKYPGFRAALDEKRYDRATARVKKEDIDFLYWAGAGWLAAFAIDPFDMEVGLTIPGAAALMQRVEELDHAYGKGAIHDFYVLYYGSLPEYMGGNSAKAREHFAKAVAAGGAHITSPYLSLATSISVKEQNLAEYKELLEKVLAVDANADPANRLVNVINQRKARWLLDHAGDFFLEEEPEAAAEPIKEN